MCLVPSKEVPLTLKGQSGRLGLRDSSLFHSVISKQDILNCELFKNCVVHDPDIDCTRKGGPQKKPSRRDSRGQQDPVYGNKEAATHQTENPEKRSNPQAVQTATA